MPDVLTNLAKPVPSIVPSDTPTPSDVLTLSDDECLRRLSRAIAEHDSDRLDEVARLIGRLAVPIE